MHIQHEIELEDSREWVGENLVFFTPSQPRGGWGRVSKLTGGGGEERENSNSKTLFYKDCSLGLIKTCLITSPC